MSTSDSNEGKQVLVVDDDANSVRGAVLEMEARGLRVDEARTLEEARALLQKEDYDALLLDLMLPRAEVDEPLRDRPKVENGLEILQTVLKGGFEPGGTKRDKPIFIITSLGPDSRVLGELRDLGVKDVFGKPVAPIYVAERIRIALGT